MNNEMFTLSDELKDLKDTKANLELKIKEINKNIKETEEKLSDFMVNSETQSFNRSGSLFYLRNKVYASAKADKKYELHEKLKDNGFASLVTETINANTLASFIKEQLENNNEVLPSWLDDLVNVYQKTLIHIRKAK